jgi:hypothetical protein
MVTYPQQFKAEAVALYRSRPGAAPITPWSRCPGAPTGGLPNIATLDGFPRNACHSQNNALSCREEYVFRQVGWFWFGVVIGSRRVDPDGFGSADVLLAGTGISVRQVV